MEEKDQNIEFLSTVKLGGLIKICFEGGRDFMLVIPKKIFPNAFGKGWHYIYCSRLYNTRDPEIIAINTVCGCKETSYVCKPSLNEYLFFLHKMKGKLQINRKLLRTSNGT